MSLNQLRPLGFGEILDGSFTLYRRHFSTLVLTALLPQIPVIVIYLVQAVVASPSTESIMLNGMLGLLTFPFAIAAYGLSRGALVHEAACAFLDRPVSRAESFAVARKRFWAVLGTGLLAGIVTGFAYILFIVPGVLCAIMFFAQSQVAVLEDTAGPEAMTRSKELASGAWGRVMGIWSVLYLALYMPILAAGVASAMFLPKMMSGASPEAIQSGVYFFQAGAALVSAVVQPVILLGMTLLYYDRRVRTEALDLQPPADAAPAYA
jgi:hypothetical protein